MLVLLLLCAVTFCYGFNASPSLLFENATMVVAIDKAFFANKPKEYYRDTLNNLFKIITVTIKEEMQTIGLAVKFFVTTDPDLHKDYSALMTIARCSVTWHLHKRARREKLVHLAITDHDCPRIPFTDGISIPVIVLGDELPQIFYDIRTLDTFDWSNVNVLHDDTFDRDTVNRVMRAVSDELPTKKVPTATSRAIFTFDHLNIQSKRRDLIKKKLEIFRSEQLGNCFLVIVTVDGVADVMEVAKSLKIVNPNTQWLYVVPRSVYHDTINVKNFTNLLVAGGNIAFLFNNTKKSCHDRNQILCVSRKIVQIFCKSIEISAKNEVALKEMVSKVNFDRLRLTKQERTHEIIENFHKILNKEKSFCDECISWKISTAITWDDTFDQGKTEVGHFIESGSWSSMRGLNLTDAIFPHVLYKFRGVTLPIVAYHNPPWQTITVNNDGQTEYGGLVFDVMNYLSLKLNFTYKVTISTDNGTIKPINISDSLRDKKSNGSFSSTIGKIPDDVLNLVAERKVLLAACAYTVNEHSKTKINFTTPIFIQAYSFLTAKPQQLSRVLLFAAPFRSETWACLAASIIIMGPILYWINKYSPCSVKTSGLNSSWQCVWYIYGALLQQGGMYLPHADSARLIVGIWWLIVMVLVATYSGSLVAFLTFPTMDATISTVEDLLARKDTLTWGFPNGSFLEEYLENSDEPKYQLLLKRSERYNTTQEESVIERVRNGKHVIIDWRTSLRFIMRKDLLETDDCYFSISAEKFLNEPLSMIMAQDSPFLQIINAELYRMHESGVMNKWIAQNMPTKDRCWVESGNNLLMNKRKVNVADMQGIFFVLFIGAVSGILFIFCECYWHRRKRSREKHVIHPFVS